MPPLTFLEIDSVRVDPGGDLDRNLSDDLTEQQIAGYDVPFYLGPRGTLTTTHTSRPASADFTWRLHSPDRLEQLRIIVASRISGGAPVETLELTLVGTVGSTAKTDTALSASYTERTLVWTRAEVIAAVAGNEECTLEVRQWDTAGGTFDTRSVLGPVCAWEQDGATR